MHIEKLKYFIDLYECRNYIETARKNFISQASISQYISSLEKEFNLTARNSPTSKVAGCKGFGLVQGLAPCA